MRRTNAVPDTTLPAEVAHLKARIGAAVDVIDAHLAAARRDPARCDALLDVRIVLAPPGGGRA